MVWLGQGDEGVVVVHLERAGVMMTGEVLKAWSEGGMKKKMGKRTVSVKARGLQFTSTYQPVWYGNNRLEVEEEKEVLAEHVRWKGKGEILVVGGDYNAHVGGGRGRQGVCGKFGLRKSNEQGEALLSFCEENGLVYVNSYYQHKKRGTWFSNFNAKWYELDGFLMSNEQRRKHVRKVNTVAETSISDHKPKRILLDLKHKKWRKVYQGKRVPKINFIRLEEEDKAREYKRKVEEEVGKMEGARNADSTEWTKLQEVVMKVAEEVWQVASG